MSEIKDNMGMKDKIHVVLRGPDGEVKDERVPSKSVRKTEDRNVTSKRPRIS